MPFVFSSRDSAPQYSVQPGDTLASIVSRTCEPGVTWKDLARYNWGTDDPAEVNRALIEIVGCRKPEDDPSRSVLDPALGTNRRILVPRIFRRDGLPTEQTHSIFVRKILPAPAISITRLDKWFIPGQESCEIEFSLEGVKERADKVELEVYASNYAKAMPNQVGEFVNYSFSPLDIPVFAALLGVRRPRASYRYDGWKGESKAADGALKPRDGQPRYINVAFSPYTVLLRYYKQSADRRARICLEPFWVEFERPDAGGVPRPREECLKIRWKVLHSTKLKHGQLIIWDKDDVPVFRKALGAADLTQGDHEYPWREGLTIAQADRMPYRVQIQAHTDIFTDDGLALAVAHTEVRLWCHADTGRDPADYWKDPISLQLAIAPFYPVVETAAEPVKAIKLRLARAGYHPGPIDDDVEREDFKIALREFQRSWPKPRPGGGFRRLRPTGELDADTKTELIRLPKQQRPLFGDPVSRADLDLGQASRRLADPNRELIVWVDDRHCYTEAWNGRVVDPVDIALASFQGYGVLDMDNYRGKMDIGDQRVAKDKESIPRPWIPVQVCLPLLSKSDPLEPTGSPPQVTEAMRRAIGPIRVDWTFRELPEDTKSLPVPPGYDKKNHRVRRFIQEIVSTNCPEKYGKADCGGILPADLSTYYKAPFGFGERNSLLPWLAFDDQGVRTVCTLVHDDLGQSPRKLYPEYVGVTGVYLRPSRIAGDGYVFCAQVSFQPLPGGNDFPNRSVLERRYPKRPLARTAGLRVWRKTCFRGYVDWTPNPQPGWESTAQEAAEYYQPAYVHFVHLAGHPQSFLAEDLITTSEFEDLVTKHVPKANVWDEKAKGAAQPKFSKGYIWPYLHVPHYGIPVREQRLSDYNTWLHGDLDSLAWDYYSRPLMMRLIEKIEAEFGLLRGHLLVEFVASPPVLVIEWLCKQCKKYYCQVANDENSTVKDDKTGIPVTLPPHCLMPGCKGTFLDLKEVDRKVLKGGLPLSAIGLPLGGCWLFRPRDAATWAHEMGHHRHLEHAQGSASEKAPAGANKAQHDSAMNPNLSSAKFDHQKCWDRFCVMSYDDSQPQAFCGKCLLRNRGWAVEGITNPDGKLTD